MGRLPRGGSGDAAALASCAGLVAALLFAYHDAGEAMSGAGQDPARGVLLLALGTLAGGLALAAGALRAVRDRRRGRAVAGGAGAGAAVDGPGRPGEPGRPGGPVKDAAARGPARRPVRALPAAVALAAVAAGALAAGAVFPLADGADGRAAAAFSACCLLVGAASALALGSAVRLLASLDLRRALPGAGAATAACGATLACLSLAPRGPAWAAAALLCCLAGAGLCAAPEPGARAGGEAGEAPADQDADARAERGGPARLPDRHVLAQAFSSVAVAGSLLGAYTTGTAAAMRGGDPLPAQGALIACLGLGVWAVSRLFLARHTEIRAGYLAFQVAVPAVASVGVVLKLIPLDAVSYEAYAAFMHAFFFLLAPVAAAHAAWIARRTSVSPSALAGCALAAYGLCMGAGLASSGLPGNGAPVTMGLLTGLFLLYAMMQAGRGILRSAQGAETSAELGADGDGGAGPGGGASPGTGGGRSVEEACAALGARSSLTPREAEVLVELAHGHGSGYIAQALYISSNTARTHMKNIYRKLGIGSREELLEIIRREQG